MNEQDGTKKVAELIKDMRFAMLTHVDGDGRLVSSPMTTQEVEFDGDIYFLAERSSHKGRDIEARSPAKVNVSYSSDKSWVSVVGTATIVDDRAKVAELWNTFADPWFEGGPENPNNIAIKIDAESAEYWDSPGAKVVQLAQLVKAKVSGSAPDLGENETVDLSGSAPSGGGPDLRTQGPPTEPVGAMADREPGRQDTPGR